jgi:hypothetical protein
MASAKTSSHPGAPTRAALPRSAPAIPEPALATLRSTDPCGRNHAMAAKPKPQPSDDAREQARRALQTSMDTRQ